MSPPPGGPEAAGRGGGGGDTIDEDGGCRSGGGKNSWRLTERLGSLPKPPGMDTKWSQSRWGPQKRLAELTITAHFGAGVGGFPASSACRGGGEGGAVHQERGRGCAPAGRLTTRLWRPCTRCPGPCLSGPAAGGRTRRPRSRGTGTAPPGPRRCARCRGPARAAGS